MPDKTAHIHGEVTYRQGEGVPIAIPRGPAEVALTHDSATLSWETATEEGPVAGLAAMPREQFERYVREGKITWAQ